MSSVVIAGDTSGTITLAAPAVSGTTTLTLPATTGTFITTGSTGQVINKASLPTGSVLQVVNATYATQVSSITSSYADSGLTSSITPLFTTSKILVMVSQSGLEKTTNDTNVNLKLFRGATDLGTLCVASAGTGSGAINNIGSFSFDYLDSPATTSSTTYKTQFASNGNFATVYVQRYSTTSTITLMEIAA